MNDLAAQVARAHVADELPAALAFANRKGVALSVDIDALRGELRLSGPAETEGAPDEEFLLNVDFAGYRTVPPLWRCVDPRTSAAIGAAAYPKPSPGQSSIFHGNGLICAPWNRGAYAENGGPHQDWNGTTNWERVPNYTVALTIGEMVDVLYRQTRAARGRYAPLPALNAA